MTIKIPDFLKSDTLENHGLANEPAASPQNPIQLPEAQIAQEVEIYFWLSLQRQTVWNGWRNPLYSWLQEW